MQVACAISTTRAPLLTLGLEAGSYTRQNTEELRASLSRVLVISGWSPNQLLTGLVGVNYVDRQVST